MRSSKRRIGNALKRPFEVKRQGLIGEVACRPSRVQLHLHAGTMCYDASNCLACGAMMPDCASDDVRLVAGVTRENTAPIPAEQPQSARSLVTLLGGDAVVEQRPGQPAELKIRTAEELKPVSARPSRSLAPCCSTPRSQPCPCSARPTMMGQLAALRLPALLWRHSSRRTRSKA